MMLKINWEQNRRLLFGFVVSALLVGCGGVSDESDDHNESTSIETDYSDLSTNDVTTVYDTRSLAPEARLFAAQCAQCHGTYGHSVTGIDSLVEEADEILEEMREYRSTSEADEIMHPHALGYTDEEVMLMQSYFQMIAAQ